MIFFLSNVFNIFSSLSFIDIVFFSLILILIISFVGMVYFVKINKKLINLEIQEKTNNSLKDELKDNDDEITHYEDDQEKTAIISYSELIKNANRNKIVYEEKSTQEKDPDISVKKINVKENDQKDYVINLEKEEEFLKELKNLQSK